MTRTSALLMACAAATVTACGGTTAKPPATPGASSSAEPESKPDKIPSTDPVVLEGGGFSLDRSKFDHNGRKNTGLKVRYFWEGDAREARVIDGANRWHVVFASRPKPGEFATIEYDYSYELTDEDRLKLRTTAARVAALVVKVLVKASVGAKGDASKRKTEFAQRSAELVDEAERAKPYSDGGATDGAELLLHRMNLEQAEGKWQPTDATIEFVLGASEQLAADVVANARDAANQRNRITGTSPCARAVDNLKDPEDPEDPSQSLELEDKSRETLTALDECWVELATVTDRLKSEVEKNNDKDKGRDKAATLQTLADLAHRFSSVKPSRLRLSTELSFAEGELNADVDSLSAAAKKFDHATTVTGSAAYHGVIYGWYRLALVRGAKKFLDTRIKKLTDEYVAYVEHVRTEEQASEVFRQSGDRRFYEITTGVVYAGGINDVVMPLMISMCPFQFACLPTGETIWNGWAHFAQAFAVDLGMKTAQLDHADPRHDGQMAFLAGGSFNPISVLRFSGGAYYFENKLSGNWNRSYYLGATLNVLQSAELLGVMGLGTPTAPQRMSNREN